MNRIYEIFMDYTFQIVVLGSVLLGMLSGALGSFVVLRKESLIGDGIAHSALPGVILFFMLFDTKNTEILLLGGLLSSLIGCYLILYIVKNSKIKFDSGLAIILSVFFGAGMVLLTIVQKYPNANQAGIDRFIYGASCGILKRDIYVILFVSFILFSIMIAYWKEFKLISFDPQFAKTLYIKVDILEKILMSLIIVAVMVGLQIVGVILMSSLLIGPCVSARRWKNSLERVVVLSGIFGALGAITGTVFSTIFSDLPTGPMIVVSISGICIFSIIFGPNGGCFDRSRRIKHE